MVTRKRTTAILVAAVLWSSGLGTQPATATDIAADFDAEIATLLHERQSAMFHLGDLKPGDRSTQDITVTYLGSVTPAAVALYVSPADMTGSGLERYLHVTVERGYLSGDGGEDDFIGSVVFSGTLEAFASLHTSHADGAALWILDKSGASQTFRLTITLLDDNRAQGLDVTVTFTWEAQTR